MDRNKVAEIVNLNVGGQLFTTSRSTLANAPEHSFLSSLLSTRIPVAFDRTGNIFIDRDDQKRVACRICEVESFRAFSLTTRLLTADFRVEHRSEKDKTWLLAGPAWTPLLSDYVLQWMHDAVRNDAGVIVKVEPAPIISAASLSPRVRYNNGQFSSHLH